MIALRRHALLVDDDPAILASLLVYASVAGLDGIAARDGLRALAMLLGGLRPALIVTDMDMPHLDGTGLIRRIRASEALCSIPVIVHSGRAKPDDRDGADLWLPKSAPSDLVAAMRDLADAHPAAPWCRLRAENA